MSWRERSGVSKSSGWWEWVDGSEKPTEKATAKEEAEEEIKELLCGSCERFFLYHSISTRFSFLCVLFKYLDDDDNLSHSQHSIPSPAFFFISVSIYFCLKNLLAFVWQKLNKNPLSTHSLTHSLDLWYLPLLQRKIEIVLSLSLVYNFMECLNSYLLTLITDNFIIVCYLIVAFSLERISLSLSFICSLWQSSNA